MYASSRAMPRPSTWSSSRPFLLVTSRNIATTASIHSRSVTGMSWRSFTAGSLACRLRFCDRHKFMMSIRNAGSTSLSFTRLLIGCRRGKTSDFFGTNDAVRNYLFLDDLAEVIARTVRKHVLGVFNCSAPLSVRLSEIATIAQQVFGQGGRIRFHHDKPDIPDLPVIDDQQSLYSVIQYEPCHFVGSGDSENQTGQAKAMTTVLVTGVGAIIGYGILRSLRQTSRPLRLIGTDIYRHAVWPGVDRRFCPGASHRQ